MLKKPEAAESKKTIAQIVGKRMGIDAEKLTCLTLQNDDLGEIWRIDGWDIPLIMRVGIKPHCKKEDYLFYEWDMMLREPYFIEKVRKETDIRVPEIFCHEARCPEIDRCFTLMECIPGKGANVNGRHSNSSFMDCMVGQLGTIARKLHELSNDSFGYIADKGSAMEPQDTWVGAFGFMLSSVMDSLVSRAAFNQEDADSIFECYEAFAPSFERVEKPALVHSDLWHANVLVNDSARILGVIDWDTALWGDPGLDFYTVNMRSLDRVAFKASYRQAGLWRDPDYLLRQKFYKLFQTLRVAFVFRVRLKMKAEANSYRNAIMDYVELIRNKPFEVVDAR